MKKTTLFLCSTAVFIPSIASAQSTGTIEAEKSIVITGTRARDVGGVQTPDTPKAKIVLTQEIISRSNPGQTILDTINMVPGVSFQNNDPYGSSGGTLTIRGFDSTRISLTFDGIQLNDSGNYAIFSNQQLDPELIEQVNVNLGSTDVDSPTASAVGGTVNYRTMTPTKEPGFRGVASIGDWNYWRLFGVFNTGEIGPWHTRAFFAASRTKNDVPFNNYGKISKQQYNGKIWQPIGSSGDFFSISGNYNQNRNNFFGSLPLRTDLTRTITVAGVPTIVPRIVGPNSQNRYPTNRHERFYDINFPCTVDAPQAGAPADSPGTATGPGTAANDPNGDLATCGTEFDRRYNPSNTGNIRVASKFTLSDGLVLTVDPSYQYVKANGGGTVTAQEGLRDINPGDPPGATEGVTATPAQCALGNTPTRTCVAGFFGGSPFFGRDINGDGDTIDAVSVVAPSQTHTDRYGVIAGLRWDFAQHQTVRVGYTLDWARHRQTGEVNLLQNDGEPVDVFPINSPEEDATGTVLEKRDRVSRAILNQFSGEYRGDFGPLTVNVGIRAPFFVRDLHNYCFTSSASGFVECSGQDPTRDAQIALLNPYTVDPLTGRVLSGFSPPQKRKFKYDKLLPNIGAIYDIMPTLSVFANYSKGLSVPSTDNLYNSFFFAPDTEQAKPKPEMTDSFDGGLRYRTGKIQAQLSGWYTHFTNREAQAFDPDLNVSVFRNLGTVNKWGLDGSVAYEPIKQLTLYAFGSWNKSKIQDNIQLGSFGTGVNQITDCDNVPVGALPSDIIKSCAFTKGNRESGSPKYTYGLSAFGDIGPISLGIEAKRTGPRFIFDNNAQMFETGVNLTNLNNASADPAAVFGKTAPAYWLVNLDARVKLDWMSKSLNKTYLQFNLYNAFDKFYVGGFGGGLAQAFNTAVTQYGNPPFVQIGAPRTFSASVNVAF
ncbi:MAG TPA: TonB-dependent receptor [Sphingomicrobium sp.]|nr:TonB-dependent receptor [Sphingomicrobium sp.]